MNRQHSASGPPGRGIGRVLRGTAAAGTVIATTIGLPWLFLAAAGSPIPDHIPNWSQTFAALSRRDDGTLLLGTVKYLAWLVWVLWTGTLLLEAGTHIAGRPAPHIPGLGGPQRLAAVLITSLGAAVIGTMASIGRGTALPAAPPSLAATAPPGHAMPALRDLAADEPEPHGPAATTGLPAPDRPILIPATLRTSTRPEHRHSAVRFEFGSATPAPAARTAITQTAREIRDHGDPAQPIVIIGHTDSLGPADYNQRLSVWRAQAVQQALGQALGHGYRFEVSGKGETAPIAAETRPDGTDNPAARAHNRRVEISYTLTRPNPTHTTPSRSTPSSGVPTPPPATHDAPSAPPPRPSSSTTPSPSASAPRHEPPATTSPTHAPTTVDLPSGAMVGLSFAAGVGTALITSRLHRRRRHRTTRSGPDLSIREPEPTAAVRALRRADLAARDPDHPDPAQAQTGDRLHLFPMASSGMIVLGVRDGEETTVPISGLIAGLTGTGADPAVRALLLALLMHAGDHDVEVIIPRHEAARLFALSHDDLDEAAAHIRALRLTTDTDAAIRLLESERIHRARLLDATTGSQDLAAVRAADPTEPLPRLVLAASPRQEHGRRLESLCAAAKEYDMAAFVLGQCPAGSTLTVDEGGNVTAAEGGDTPRWEGVRLFHLTAEDAHQVLDVIRSAHGAPEPEPTSGPAEESDPFALAAAPSPLQAADAAQDRPAHLRVLGPPTLISGGTELSTGIRGKARELLTFLAVHSDGAARDTILAALWPDIDQRRGVMRFHAALNDVRRELRRASGLTDESFIAVIAERYRIDSELISVDLWHFRTALHKASRADDNSARRTLLQQAADTYTGHLAAEQPFEWIEPEREALRRQAVETLIHLAELREHDEPEHSLDALERARTLDRYTEEIYQRIMSLQGRLSRKDAIRRTYRLLETALEELGADPSAETQQLLWQLLHDHAQP